LTLTPQALPHEEDKDQQPDDAPKDIHGGSLQRKQFIGNQLKHYPSSQVMKKKS